jgi:hypothetical protein
MKTSIIVLLFVAITTSLAWGGGNSYNSGIVDTPAGVSFPNGIDTANTPTWGTNVASVHQSTGIDTHESITSCEPSINAVDASLLDIADCWLHIKGPEYFFNATTISPNSLAGQNSSFIGATMNGYTTQLADFSITQLKTIVPIARVNTELGDLGPGSDIHLLRHDHYFLGERDSRDKTYFSRVFGAQYVKGGELFANATSLTLGQYSGLLFDGQTNPHALGHFNNMSAIFIHLSSNEVDYIPTKKALIADNYYYNPAGSSLIALSNTNKYKADTILKSPKGANGAQEGGWFYLYGTQEFDTAAEAKAEALVRFGVFIDPATSGLVPLAIAVINRDATTVEEIIDQRRCFVCRP